MDKYKKLMYELDYDVEWRQYLFKALPVKPTVKSSVSDEIDNELHFHFPSEELAKNGKWK